MRTAGALLGLILLLSLTACDGFTHIKGKVTDINGKPVAGAQVEMKTLDGGRDRKVDTDPDGSFSVAFTHAPYNIDLVVTVSKDGYQTFEKRFKSRDAEQFPATITLGRAPSLGASK